MTALTSVDAFEEIFREEERLYWRIYKGHSTKAPKIGENREVDDLERSLELLVRRVEQYAPGAFTIVLLNSPKESNAQGQQHTIKIEGVQVSGSTQSQIAGPGLFGQMMQFMEFMKLMQNQSDQNIGGAVEGAVEEMKLRFEIERLNNEVERLKTGGVRERIIDSVGTKMPQIIDRIFPPHNAALGSVGISDEEVDVGETDDELEEGGTFSVDQLILAAQEIQELLPDQNVIQLLWKLVRFIKKDPDQAKMVISRL